MTDVSVQSASAPLAVQQPRTAMSPLINPSRLAAIEKISLKRGSHYKNLNLNACAMEAVAYLAGEPWSDSPACVCPVIATFVRSWNDSFLSDAERDRLLKGLIPEMVGTRNSIAVEKRRSLLAVDWLIRIHTPAWLRLAKLNEHAKLLEALPELTDFAQCESLVRVLKEVKKDAAAAWAAAGAAACNATAAWAAARAAAGAAACNAACNATAAGDAAWDAAWAASGAASAAGDALAPTVTFLQDSAVALVRRMIAVAEPL